MNRDSEITSSSSSLPPALERVSTNLRWSGTIGFWVQLVLGVISTVTLLFASSSLIGNQQSSQGTGFGIFCAVGGLVALAISIFLSFRYMNIAKLLRNKDSAQRPKKTDTIQIIRIGLMVNIVGMTLAIIGAEALVGLVLAKSLARPQLAIGSDPREFVNSIDLLIVQANTNTITAHFGGLVSSLWLLNRITK
jgi:hypothetical protein